MSNEFVLHKDDAGRPRVLANLLAFIQKLPEGKAWKVTVAAYQKRRSDSQNRYLWAGVYGAFQSVLEGWDKEDIHDYLLGEWAGWETIEGMGRKRLKPVRRSSKLSKVEFAEYVDFCIRKGAEHGIYVEPPKPGEFDWA